MSWFDKKYDLAPEQQRAHEDDPPRISLILTTERRLPEAPSSSIRSQINTPKSLLKVYKPYDDKRKRQKTKPTEIETEAHIPTDEEIAAAEQTSAYIQSYREA